MLTSGSSVCRPSLLGFPLSLRFPLDSPPFQLDSPPFQLFLELWLPSLELSLPSLALLGKLHDHRLLHLFFSL